MTAFGLVFFLVSSVAATKGDDGWSEWGDWAPCTATCGLASQYRSRVCNIPVLPDGGNGCEGRSRQKRRCDLKVCPADGEWSLWSDWSECSVTCGDGERQRFRSCDNPSPSFGGKECSMFDNDIEFCSDRDECPVNGGWSRWASWTPCSRTCGKGVRRRQRKCTNPAPQRGGRGCDGVPEQRETCSIEESCTRDGQWSSWSEWSRCTATCGEGKQERTRSCGNPPPLGDGKPCRGYTKETGNCFAPMACPRDGQWSSWSEWSDCTVTCGDGTRQRSRSCDNPTPLNGGKPCEGRRSKTEACPDRIECPINGQWSRWSMWSRCGVTCGTAEIRRFRSCNNPPPKFGGSDCIGDPTDVDICDAGIKCPVNGQWSEWSSYGPCLSTNCRKKVLSLSYRQRSCNNPVPAHRGLMCQGEFVNAGICRTPVNCPIDGKWSEWSKWECNAAIAKRTRSCDKPPPTNGGKNCPDFPALEFHRRDEEEEAYSEVCGNPNDENEG